MTSLRRITQVLALAGLACGHDFEPPDRAERMREAEEAYLPAAFDSIAWASPEERLSEGNTVYVEQCRRCHGPLGMGATDYARERGLEIPSLVTPEWRLSGLDALRHEIFVGHETGMPVFGDDDLALRQIDAVAGYILATLRPEVIDGG